jgi:hypothetical protein
VLTQQMGPIEMLRRATSRLAYIASEHTRPLPAAPSSRAEHEAATLDWLLRAHDAGGDGGVAAGYQPARRVWFPSYPETTGYIIPTFLRTADLLTVAGSARAAADLRARAIQMGAWEIAVQMPEGCVQADYLGTTPRPAVFNTGQVLFGWCALHDLDRDPRWLAAATRAVDWLVAHQEPDGSWRQGQSPKATNPVHSYDVRVAWALAEYHRITQHSAAGDAARRAADWTARQQQSDGWFEATAFDRGTAPTTHPIGYVLEGLLACGLRFGEERWVATVERAADALLARLDPQGTLAAAYGPGWSPAARTTCLTGNAQIAIAWGWLYALRGEDRYRRGLAIVNRFIARTQRLADPDPGIRGGVKGSHPNTSGYSPFLYPNWAAKFVLDAFQLEDALEREDQSRIRARLPWCG